MDTYYKYSNDLEQKGLLENNKVCYKLFNFSTNDTSLWIFTYARGNYVLVPGLIDNHQNYF